MYYTKGIGYTENEPLITTDENGQRVVQTSGLVRTGAKTADGGLSRAGGDRLAKSYDVVKTNLRNALAKWRDSKQTVNSGDDNSALEDMYVAYKIDGRYTGTYEDFPRWLNAYMAQMKNETMDVSALANTRGETTANRNKRLTQEAKSSGSVGFGSR